MSENDAYTVLWIATIVFMISAISYFYVVFDDRLRKKTIIGTTFAISFGFAMAGYLAAWASYGFFSLVSGIGAGIAFCEALMMIAHEDRIRQNNKEMATALNDSYAKGVRDGRKQVATVENMSFSTEAHIRQEDTAHGQKP